MKRALSKVCNMVSRRAVGPAETNGRSRHTGFNEQRICCVVDCSG